MVHIKKDFFSSTGIDNLGELVTRIKPNSILAKLCRVDLRLNMTADKTAGIHSIRAIHLAPAATLQEGVEALQR